MQEINFRNKNRELVFLSLGTQFTEDITDYVTRGYPEIIHSAKTSSCIHQVSSHSGTRPKPGVHKLFQKSRSQLEIPGARRVTCGKFHTGNTQILGSTVQNCANIRLHRTKFRHHSHLAPGIYSPPPLNHTTVVQLQNAVYLMSLRAEVVSRQPWDEML